MEEEHAQGPKGRICTIRSTCPPPVLLARRVGRPPPGPPDPVGPFLIAFAAKIGAGKTEHRASASSGRPSSSKLPADHTHFGPAMDDKRNRYPHKYPLKLHTCAIPQFTRGRPEIRNLPKGTQGATAPYPRRVGKALQTDARAQRRYETGAPTSGSDESCPLGMARRDGSDHCTLQSLRGTDHPNFLNVLRPIPTSKATSKPEFRGIFVVAP